MVKTKKEWLFLAIILLTLIVSGCASAFNSRELNLLASGNFKQLDEEYAPPADNYSAMPFSRLFYLCAAYSELKNYKKLFPCLDVAQAKVDAGDYRADLWNHSAGPARLRTNALIELGQYEEAVKAAENCYHIVISNKLKRYDEINALGSLGMAYALAGKTIKAEEVAQKLCDMDMGHPHYLLKDDRNIALAKIYIALKKYQEALATVSYKFEDSNTFLKSFAGWDVFELNKISFEFMKNKTLFEVGRLAEAKEGYDALLKFPHIQDRGEMHWNILFDRGRIAEKEGNLTDAIEYYKRAVDIIEQQRSTISIEASKIGFVGDKQAVYHALIKSLFTDHQYEKVFSYVERSKSRALVDLLAGKQDFAVMVAGKEEQLKTALSLNDSLEAEVVSLDSAADKPRTRSLAVKARSDLQREAPELSSLVTVNTVELSEIKALIPKGETLLEYYYSGNEMYAFVLSGQGLQNAKINVEGLAEDVAALRKSLESPGSPQTRELSVKLYRRLIMPLAGALNDRDLVIVPHGVLHYLPMNALHDGRNYLIDSYNIRFMPSASAMKYLREKKNDKTGGILIFGNPDLGDPGNDLAFAQQEALDVAKIWANSKVLLRKNATLDALRRYGSSYNYIHFATHGQFSPDSPLNSAILLSPDANSDGHLTVDRLYSMQLDANLVTLSACETGLSKVANGDDLVGLTRGFLYGGSNSIVASLWKVDDLATSHLMTRFYQGLQKTDKRDALRRAQLETGRNILIHTTGLHSS